MKDFTYCQTTTHWVFTEQDRRKHPSRCKTRHYPKNVWTLPEAYRDWEGTMTRMNKRGAA